MLSNRSIVLEKTNDECVCPPRFQTFVKFNLTMAFPRRRSFFILKNNVCLHAICIKLSFIMLIVRTAPRDIIPLKPQNDYLINRLF